MDVSEEANTAVDRGRKSCREANARTWPVTPYHPREPPEATSRDTTASAFLERGGIGAPRLVTEVVVVFRTFPDLEHFAGPSQR